MTIPECRRMDKKETDLFKNLVNFYETKQNKKGLKAADSILKKYPNHGETQAMKGLIMNAMGNKEEALELVKLGVRNDMRSHVTWHVYGIYHRSNKHYKDAAKCYMNALRWEKDNIQILRDLSYLQIQLRDFDAFVESRRQLLVLRPDIRANWVCFAVAQFKAGNNSEAFGIVNNYRTSSGLKDDKEAMTPYEVGEFLLFQNMCLERDKKYKEVLEHLSENESEIPDKLSIRVKRAEIMSLLGDYESARPEWFSLVEEQPMNYRFHCGYQIAILELDLETATEMLALERHNLPCSVLSLSATQKQQLLRIYTEELSPSQTVTKILLGLYDGEILREKMADFLQKGIERGFPALYNDICSLIMIPDVVGGNPSRKVYATDACDLRDHPVMLVVLQIIDGFIENLRSNGTFEKNPGEIEVTPAPTCLMWALFLRCHLYGMLGRLPEALTDIEEAISHTPTSLDCLHKRARILKLCGDFQGAAIAMDYCRSLDLQDRYVNNKATKYFLRADKIKEAKDTIAMFSKHDGDPEQSLHFMQSIWYTQETAESYLRTENWKMALKKFYTIEEFFNTFLDDQFDFHSFAMRKTTVRAYLDAIENLDEILAHPSFQAAARGAITVLLHRMDNPVVSVEEVTVDLSKLSASERKKEKARQRKLKNKLEAENATKENSMKEEPSNAKDPNKKSQIPPDDDPEGDKVWAKDPMEEAVRLAERLIQHSPQNSDSYDIVCEVMMRCNNYELFLDCLIKGLKFEPCHAHLTFKLLLFAKRFHEGNIEMSSECQDKIRLKLQSLNCDTTELLKDFFTNFVAKVTKGDYTLLHRVIVAKSILLFDSTATGQAAAALLDENLWCERGVTFRKCLNSYNIICKELGKVEGLVDSFKEKMVSRFPISNFSGFMASDNYTGIVESENTD